MIKYLLTSTLFFVCLTSFSQQSIKQYFESEKKPIRTVDPADEDYTDLEAFGNAIGNKRVVMLGEQDHGDAVTFLAKTRLIKYLYEKKGFTVLAFESDFFGLTQGQEEIQNDTTGFRKYMQGNIFSLWPYCDACASLFYDFLPKKFVSDKPMIVTGFDSQPHSRYSRKKLAAYLDSILTDKTCPLPDLAAIKSVFIQNTDSLVKKFGNVHAIKDVDGYNNLVDVISNAYFKQNGKDYNWQLLQSIKAYNQQNKEWQKKKQKTFNTRDAAMATNLNWIVNEMYKDKKIIVWAANYHIMNNSWDAVKKDFIRHYSMGNEFLKDATNKQQTYVMGFTSKKGTAGRIGKEKKYDIRKLPEKSAENWFGDIDYAFIDFDKYNITMPAPEYFTLNGKSHYPADAQWTRCYDGIFYIRNMHACNPLY